MFFRSLAGVIGWLFQAALPCLLVVVAFALVVRVLAHVIVICGALLLLWLLLRLLWR